MKIEIGDYIRSDFFSPMQGTVMGEGLMGKIPAYRIITPHGKTEYIIKGQAEVLWTRDEAIDGGFRMNPRHD